MANKEYFRGCRVEDFLGWNGQGSPSWYSINPTDSGQTNALATTRLTSAQTLPNGLHGCLWSTFKDPDTGNPALLNDFWFAFEYRSSQRDTNAWNSTGYGDYTHGAPDMLDPKNYPFTPFVLHSATETKMLVIRPKLNANTFAMCITDSVSDTTNDLDLGMPAFSPDGKIHRHSIQIVGGGTSNGSINWYIDGTAQGSYTGDLSTFRNFSALSFHGDIGTGYSGYSGWVNHYGDLTYCFVTNYKTIRAYLDYRVGNDVAKGTAWQGKTDDFSTYPTQLNTLNGIFSDTNGQAFSPVFNKTFNAAAVYYPKTVVTKVGLSQQQLLSGTGLTLSAAQGTTTGRSIGSLLTPDDGFYAWSSSIDPTSQKDWTTDTLNGTTFSVTRDYLEDD